MKDVTEQKSAGTSYPAVLSSRSSVAAALAALLGAMVLLLATRTILGHAPLYDEMLHVTAAQGIIATGRPAIADGEYPRAELFTRLVAKSFELQGVSLKSARTPALLAGALLTALLGAWVARRAGFVAGASAAVLLASIPFTIQLSAFARFYTLHGLLVACAAIAAFESLSVERTRFSRGALALIVLASLAVALHLQPTTLIAAGALVLAVATVLLYDHWNAFVSYFQAHRLLLFVGATAGVCVSVLLIWKLDLLSMAGEAPLWAAERATRFQFYLVLFAREMPLLWPMFVPAALLAVLVQPRLTAYCAVFFLSAFAVHSLAAAKAGRYIFYVVPFMFAVWGIAVAALIKQVSDGFVDRVPGTRLFGSAVAILLVLVVALSSVELQRAGRLVIGRYIPDDVPMFLDTPDWTMVLPALTETAARADVKIVSSGVKGVYYLGGYDYELNASVVRESETGAEFGRDLRTGREVISTPDSLNKVLNEAGSALVVIERSKLATASGVPAESVAVLERRCHEIVLAPASGVAAWVCRN